jgi:hypothetical protein
VAATLAPMARRLNGDALTLRNWLAQIGPFPLQSEPLDAPDESLDEPFPRSGSQRSISLAGGSVTGSVGELLRGKGEGGPMWRWLAPLLVTVALTAVAGYLFLPRHATVAPLPPPPPATVTGAPAAQPAPAPAAPEPERETLLVVKGTDGAEVLVDDNLVGTVPLEVHLPRHLGTRHLLVRMDGYKSYARPIAGDSDVKLTVTLKAQPSHSRSSTPHAAPVVRNPFDQ